MSKKDGQSHQTTYPETNRRTFLKTSAAVAGTALTGAAVKASPAYERTEAFIIYGESSVPSADDYLIDADYSIETYIKIIHRRHTGVLYSNRP